MHKVDMKRIREASLVMAERLGFLANPALPLLDFPASSREAPEVVDRILGMHCVAACAFGFSRERAEAWHRQEVQQDALTDAERSFLRTGVGNRQKFMVQIEGMWALAWAIGSVADLDFGQACSSSFVGLLPDLKKEQSALSFRSGAAIRTLEKLASASDLAYCLHWAVRQAELSKRPLPRNIGSHVIIERRRALEWLLGSEAWDDVPLDT
jgi:hypothetical protein